MTASLVIRTPEGGHYEVSLGQTCTLGRDPYQDIQILDERASRVHAAIAYADGHFWLQDRSSKNGTYLNGLLVRGSMRLVDGDSIQIAETIMSFNDRCRAGARVIHEDDLSELGDPSEPFDRLSHLEFPSSSDGSCSGSVDE